MNWLKRKASKIYYWALSIFPSRFTIGTEIKNPDCFPQENTITVAWKNGRYKYILTIETIVMSAGDQPRLIRAYWNPGQLIKENLELPFSGELRRDIYTVEGLKKSSPHIARKLIKKGLISEKSVLQP